MWQTTSSPAVRLCHAGGTSIAELGGEIDIATRDGITHALDEFLRDTPHPRLVVDLRPILFADTTLLKILCRTEAGIARGHGRMRIVVVSPLITRMLQVTGLDRRFPSHRTVSAAVVRVNAGLVRATGRGHSSA